jgi:hypothetical protein
MGVISTNKEALIEAGKEFLRVVVLAIIPLLIDGLSKGYMEWSLIWITGAIAGLRFIDKYLHLLGVAAEEASTKKKPVVSPLTLGLTRF